MCSSDLTVEVRVTDIAGNVSTSSLSFTLDTTVGQSILSLANDSVTSDSITNDGTVSVSGVDSDATWEYRVNGGDWTTGEGSSFVVGGADGEKTVEVRVTDIAGNVSTSSLSFTLDTTAPTTTVSTVTFSDDTGTSGTDFITSAASQTISGTLSAGLLAGEVVKISLDNGGTWQTATATEGSNTFTLSGVTLTGSNTLQVRVEDAAGNAGTSTAQAYVLDTTASAPAVSLTSDTGN